MKKVKILLVTLAAMFCAIGCSQEIQENTFSSGTVLVFDYTGTIVDIYTNNEGDASEITYVEVDTNENGRIVFEVGKNTTIEGTDELSSGQQIAIHCEYSNHRHYAMSMRISETEASAGVDGLLANSDDIQQKSFPLSSDAWDGAKTMSQNHFAPTPELERLPASRVGETLVDRTLPTGQRIVLFHPAESPDEFTKCWAVDRGDTMDVFCVEITGYEMYYGVDTYENVLGHDGFRIYGPRGSSYDFYDYWYFDENDTPRFLAAGSNYLYETDLNDDSTKELLSLYGDRANYTYAEADVVYDVDLIDLIGNIDGWIFGKIDFDFEHAGAHIMPRTDGRECLPILLRQPDDWEQTRKATLFFSADGIDLVT